MPPPFTSIPFDTTSLPSDFASMFMNMAANATTSYQGQHSRERPGEDYHMNGPDEPEIRIGGNINLNFVDQMPEQLTGALRSVMEMVAGAASNRNSEDNTDERPRPN